MGLENYGWENYVWVIWILSSLALVRLYICVFSHKSKLIAKPSRERFGTPRILFQVTTKGNIPIVQETVDRINSVCRDIGYQKYEVWVVTDAQERFKNCRTITVPSEYSCNAIHKGRALQYAAEIRKEEKKNTEDIYVFHLDDESLITKQTLCSVLTFLEDNPSPISEGLITYPLQKNEKFKITHLIDTLRPFCCFECLDFMHKGNPAYIHGSNLLIRSDVEEEVSWENGKTIAEDTLFAVSARTKCGSDSFGWHGGVIEERSPLSLRDLVKQRKRWFYGLIQNLKFMSLKDRIVQGSRALLWSLGFYSGLVSIIVLLGVPQDMSLGYGVWLDYLIKTCFLVTSILWLLSYQIGGFFNGKYLPLKRRVLFHFLILVSSFFLGLIECTTPILALISRPKTFEIVKKRNSFK